MKGKLLYNRVCVNETARVSLRQGWQDIAWKGTDFDKSGPSITLEGIVNGVSGHRMSLHVGEGHVHVLRRVDIEAIEAHR